MSSLYQAWAYRHAFDAILELDGPGQGGSALGQESAEERLLRLLKRLERKETAAREEHSRVTRRLFFISLCLD